MGIINKGLQIKGRKRKKSNGVFLLVLISVCFILFMLGAGMEEYSQSKVVINEICSDNESVVLNDNGQIEDYVELYNSGSRECKLDGLFLSDDKYELKKMPLEGYTIAAEGFLLIPCVDTTGSFAINNKGETIYFSNEDGKILEQIETYKLDSDIAYIRNEEAEWEIGKCTPNLPNDMVMDIYANPVNAPVLSHESGFYQEEFELAISSAENTVIYYTLDGSVPDEGAYVYEGPIKVYDKSSEPNTGMLAQQNVVRDWQTYEIDKTPVDKAFLIRALAMDNAGNKSDVITATYFINKEYYENRKVISLVTDPRNLYDDETGIYVTGTVWDEWYLNGQEGDKPTPNFRQKGRDWEREASFTLFDDTKLLLSQEVGIRIQGSGSRENTAKRFSIYARDEYSGSDFFDIPLFDNDMRTHSVVLRSNSADCICQELLAGRGIPYQRYERVHVFLNGEFLYGTYLREKYSEQYFKDYYGIDKDNIIVIKGNEVSSGVETDMILFNELYRFIEENDFSNENAYQELENRMDIQSYIDFMVTNIYCANMDVIMEQTKNVLMWRSREVQDSEYGDGRWRFGLFDMDSMAWNLPSDYGVEISAQIDAFSQKLDAEGRAYNETIIYSALRKNPEFCRQFVLTCMDLMNTSFTVENAAKSLENVGKDITWTDSFFEKRPEYMKQHVAKEFGLTGTIEKVALYNEDETEGKIILNTITPAMINGSWSGEYFTDYPVTVTAQPAEGYEFIGWSGSVVSDEITIEVPVTEGGIELTAEFQKIK